MNSQSFIPYTDYLDAPMGHQCVHFYLANGNKHSGCPMKDPIHAVMLKQRVDSDPLVQLTIRLVQRKITPALRVMADAITNLPHPGKVVRRKAM